MGRRNQPEEPPTDPSGWLLDNGLSQFLIMHTNEIKYMCMLGYTFLHGTKVFSKVPSTAPLSYKFISLILACTGGGIMVPIFINSIPVPLSTDAYPVAIFASFILHNYFPILREVMRLSPLFTGLVVFLYETQRAYVVMKLTVAAGAAIPASDFAFPIFGPIFCGAIAGCGGAFLPLNKGLDPIKNGLAPNMLSALFAATFIHLFLSTSLSNGIMNAAKKTHVIVALGFILFGLQQKFEIDVMDPFGKKKAAATAAAPKVKAEAKKQD
eukprot:CAMPEP_0119015150 /NCGR_PEP_ID=MMETSP1176-20130426/10585_1 /TAXON_ID=265551 /ORGANISM="Synedropsis recta cf, Strain CCMP1620" /LENGTH=267 /DNA_ID=CAMNT_0006968419 /DNA_START=40 /DNA_END=843 /DNA_ORIENTATION=-